MSYITFLNILNRRGEKGKGEKKSEGFRHIFGCTFGGLGSNPSDSLCLFATDLYIKFRTQCSYNFMFIAY